MTTLNPQDTNLSGFDDSAYEQEKEDERIEQARLESEQQMAELRQGRSTEPQQPEPKPAKKKGGKFLDEMLDDLPSYAEQGADGKITTDEMGGKQRAVAGAIDTVMDMTSKFLPFMKGPADWWDEVSGRKEESDPFKKAERDMAAIVVPMFAGAGVIGAGTKAAGLTGKTKLLTDSALNLGLDAIVSGTSDTTSEAGNLGSLIEQVAPGGVRIPWASRDTDSPDVIYWKNMAENMVLGFADPIVTALTFGKGTNKIIPKNNVAQAAVDAKPAGPGSVQDAILRNRAKKQAEQLKIGKRVLEADPEGVNGYNAFVNEPAEDVARITLDETGDAVDFMADQARIQNNVGTYEGRARPLLDSDTQEILSRADAGGRKVIMQQAEEALRAEFDVVVGGKKLTSAEINQAINNLYDAAIAPIGKSFDDTVKQFRDLELKVGNMTDTVTSRGGRKVIGKTIERLTDAMSPQRLRTSAAIQAQTAAGVSDIARNVDLMEPVADTSRLQEIMMPRLRVLLKEQATSQISESMSTTLQKKLAKDVSTIEGALEVDEKYMNEMFDAYTKSVEAKSIAIDDFVDELTEMAKENPSFLKPVYRLFAKTNGEVDSMYKLNQYLNKRLGLLRKAIADGDPEVPSLILKEMQYARTANMINGTAPAVAWVQNLAAVGLRPMTQLSGSVALGVATGDFKQLQRSLNAFSQLRETIRRATAMARSEWRFANANPNSAMKRGRKDYDFSAQGTSDPKKTLADFEELEELSETFSPGRKALWNATKWLNTWNGRNFNRWGINAMYSADGFLKSVMASFDSRLKAYDDVIAQNNGAFVKEDFVKLEKDLYSQAFDDDGVLKDGYAKFASEEIALNADVPAIQAIEKAMDKFPILKGIFMFPRTKINAISVVQTYDPTGVLSLWQNRSFKTIMADAGDPAAVKSVLEEHGFKGGTMDDFLMLKSEYIGRKMATSGVVMTGAMAAMSGELTGSGSNMSPADKKRAIRAGYKPYMLFGRSYENAPDWVKMSLSLTADITNAFAGVDGEQSQDWFRAIATALSANVGNEYFGSEVETLSGLINGDPGSMERYFSGLVDTMIPGAGVRSALNNVITPQLQDVEDNFLAYLANRNRFITDPLLQDDIDPFTGEPIYGNIGPLEALVGRVMPFWNTKGGTEDWRKWMLSTGWTGLSEPMINKETGEEITPDTRQWINRYIGQELKGQWVSDITKLMEQDGGKFAKEWKQSGRDLKIEDSYIHEELTRLKKKYFDAAWAAWKLQNNKVVGNAKALEGMQKDATRRNSLDDANQYRQTREEQLENITNLPVK